MDKVGIEQDLVPLAKLVQEIPYFLLGHQLHRVDVILQGPSVAVLHDDVQVVLAFDVCLEAVDEVFLVGQVPDDLQLGLDGVQVVGLVEVDDLGHEGLSRIVLAVGLVDLSVAAIPQLFVLRYVIGRSL